MSLCVALRSQPSHLSIAAHPIVNIRFACKARDDPDFSTWDSRLNLPIGFRDPLWLEYDTERFLHIRNVARIGSITRASERRNDEVVNESED
jgi:hypothetical protein